MGSEVSFGGELRARASASVRIEAATHKELLEKLRRHLAGDLVLSAFSLALDAPVPEELREQIVATARRAIETRIAQEWLSIDWTDDLVEVSGWQGVRAQIDPALAPCFAGGDEESRFRYVGVWTDERTFICVELSELDARPERTTRWDTTWVRLAHWDPDAPLLATSADELHLVDPGGGPPVLVGLRHFDQDGTYTTVSPVSPDPATNARTIVDFIEDASLGGVQRSIVPLVAHGFPADGAARQFPIDLLPGANRPGYEIFSLIITPPADVRAVLDEHGKLDAEAARTLRDAIHAGLAARWGPDATLKELSADWRWLIERLEKIG